MAKNYLTRFATSPDANVLTDVELAAQPELASGFITKSKASSKLIGKLFQNAAAGSAALGDYIVAKTGQDVKADDADLGTKLAAAITKQINTESPKQDLSGYATKTELTNGLAEKAAVKHTHAVADVTNLQTALNAKLDASAAFTKTTADTLYLGKTAKAASATAADSATKASQDASGNVITSTYATKSELTSGLAGKLESSALTPLMPKSGGTFTGAVTVLTPTANMHPATKQYVDAAVNAVYKYKGSVKNESELPSQSQVIGDVYNVEDTGMNVAWDGTKWDKLGIVVDLSGYATTANVNAELAKKAPTASPTFTGTVTAPTFKGTLSGNAATATSATSASSAAKLTTARTIAIAGAVTGTATSFDGSANISISTTAVAGAKVTGTVAAATKATQDSTGQAINTTYIKGLSVSGKVITYTRGDNTTGTITTQDTNTTYSNMTAASTDAAGKAGLVPAPGAGAQAKFLRGDGTWQTPANTDTKVTQTVSTTAGEFALLAKDQTAVTTTTRGSVFAAGVTVNPSTKTVTATTFKGALSGNATTATTATTANKTKTALTLQLNGGSAQTFDGSTARTFNVTAAGIGALPTSGGTVSGSLTVSNALKAATITATSDARLKNVLNRHNAMSSMYKLSAVDFSFVGSDDSKHIGLIAQEVQELYPDLVQEDDRGYLSIDYCGVTALLVNDMKHLLNKISRLEQQIEALKRDI